MNTTRQQEYLSAMGIDVYFPRWTLPCAAPSQDNLSDKELFSDPIINNDPPAPTGDIQQTDHLLQDVLSQIEETIQIKSAASKQIPLTQTKQISLQPFSLSVWRPTKNFLVIANREAQALPTELLLHNILRYYLNHYQLKMDEEVVRWPANSNIQARVTENDVYDELQTWLSVQHEFQPIEQLWFFGGSLQYFVKESDVIFNSSVITLPGHEKKIAFKSFPDLAEILRNPKLKADVLSCL